MTSATPSLAIEGVKDGDGQTGPTTQSINNAGGNGGKEKWTSPAAHTAALEQLACPDVKACCKCGPTLTYKTAQCECRKAAHACVSCQCLGQCATFVTHTRRERQRKKGGATTGETGTGKRKRRRGRARGEKAQMRTDTEAKEDGMGRKTLTTSQQTKTSGELQRGVGRSLTAPTEGGRGGGGQARVHPEPGGPSSLGGLRRLGSCQSWRPFR